MLPPDPRTIVLARHSTPATGRRRAASLSTRTARNRQRRRKYNETHREMHPSVRTRANHPAALTTGQRSEPRRRTPSLPAHPGPPSPSTRDPPALFSCRDSNDRAFERLALTPLGRGLGDARVRRSWSWCLLSCSASAAPPAGWQACAGSRARVLGGSQSSPADGSLN